ncbi:ABC transporter substrate-binding protein [Conexibacter arvalis]|uniref:ABC-type branched-subunit amino acid transport system substrate-binding protein n=1 Tax=Conexibacter arvalis TaxID=912552 RepID=A0A840IIY9_9ACTN|nr:ABC-type branched-subunit amino acid transport system substrate-binding protein [Conexibacter arvalis]
MCGLLVGAAFAAGCGSGEESSSTGGGDGEIVVGTIMPLSGPQQALSNSYAGMRAAFADVNDRGGIGGHRVKIVVRDDQFKPAQTPKAARELVEGENVVMLCSNQGSGGLTAIAPYLQAKRVGSVAQSGEPALFPPDSTAFQMLTPYGMAAARLVDHFTGERGLRKVAIAYTEDGVGLPFREGAELQLERAGLKPAAVVKFNAAATDLAPAAAKLKASGADVVVVNHVAPVIGQLARATARVGYTPQWGLTFAAQNRQLLELGGAALDGKVVFATPFPTADDPVLADYRASMERRFPEVDAEDFLSIEGFAAGKVCAGVLEQAVEAAGGKTPSREQVLDALASFSLDEGGVRGLRWTAEDHTGPRGLQLIEPDGDGFRQVSPFENAPEVPVGDH